MLNPLHRLKSPVSQNLEAETNAVQLEGRETFLLGLAMRIYLPMRIDADISELSDMCWL